MAFLLKQKAALEGYETPTALVVFDGCPVLRDQNYAEIISDCEKLRYTTVTVVQDVTEINTHLLSKMNILVFFKDRNKAKQNSRNRSIWERKYKNLVAFDQFHTCILDGTGAMKASMATSEGMFVLKLGRNGIKMSNVCAFKDSGPSRPHGEYGVKGGVKGGVDGDLEEGEGSIEDMEDGELV